MEKDQDYFKTNSKSGKTKLVKGNYIEHYNEHRICKLKSETLFLASEKEILFLKSNDIQNLRMELMQSFLDFKYILVID